MKIKLRKYTSDFEIRQAAMLMPNGEYVTKICKRCGAYKVDPYGDTNKAKIMDECNECRT